MHWVEASQTLRQTGEHFFLTWSAQIVSLNKKCEICLIVSLLNDIKGSTTNGAVTLCIRVVVIAFLHINSYVPRLKPDNVSNDVVWSTTVPSAPDVYEQCLCSDMPIRDKNS